MDLILLVLDNMPEMVVQTPVVVVAVQLKVREAAEMVVQVL
jgi:hypothetical protein